MTKQTISSEEQWPRKKAGRSGFYTSLPKVSRHTLLWQSEEGCPELRGQGGRGWVATDGFRVYFKKAEMSPD